MKPEQSFQLSTWACFCTTHLFHDRKTAQLKEENSAQTVFKFPPVSFRTPHSYAICTTRVLGLALLSLDNQKLSGWNQSRVFNSRHGRAFAPHTSFMTEKLPNLKMIIQPKQFLSSLLLAFAVTELLWLFLLLVVRQTISLDMYQSGTFVRTLAAHPFKKIIRWVPDDT
jgi:hypothetical protein